MSILALVVLALVWKLGGATGVAYASVLLLAAAPGLPLGFRVFGSAHPAGWLAGAICGYGLSSMAVWFARVSGFPPTPTALIGGGCVTGTTWLLVRRAGSRPLWLKVPVWTS